MNSPLWPTILDLPADRAAQPAWLDRMLLSPDLADSIHALQLIHRRSPEDADALPPVEQVLDSELDRVLTTGFAALSIETVAVLLQNPELLFELQELVLLSDSPYWSDLLQQLSQDEPQPEFVQPPALPTTAAPNSRGAAQQELRPPGTSGQQQVGAPAPLPAATPQPPRRLLRLAATLAVVALGAVLLWQALPAGWQDPPGISGKGLGTPRLFQQNTSDADAYLRRMATAVEDLLKESDLTRQSQLVAVLQNTIQDCEIAITQPHPILAQRVLSNGQTAEAVFRTRCKKWRDDLRATLAELQQGTIDVPAASGRTTEILQKLMKRLSDPRGAEGLV